MRKVIAHNWIRLVKVILIGTLLIVKAFAVYSQHNSIKVTQLIILGNKKTKEGYLRKFIETKQGEIYDSLIVEEDMRRLRNLPSILDAQNYMVENDSGALIIYQLTERFTILPIGDFGWSDDYFYFGLGAMESNGFGRGIYLLGYYRFTKQHSFQSIFKIPYLWGTPFGIQAQVIQWNTVERIEIDNQHEVYKYNYTDVQMLVRYEFNPDHKIHFGYTYHIDKFKLKNNESVTTFPDNYLIEYSGLKLIHDLKHLDYKKYILDGWSNYLTTELRFPLSNHSITSYLLNKFLYFRNFANSTNFCFRGIVGLSGKQFDSFAEFTFDDYTNMRGIGYNAKRGNALTVVNLDIRQKIFETRRYATQAVIFSDIGTIRSNQQTYAQMFSMSNYDYFTGGGLRLIFKDVHDAVLSLDYGIDIQNFDNQSFIFRWGQFF